MSLSARSSTVVLDVPSVELPREPEALLAGRLGPVATAVCAEIDRALRELTCVKLRVPGLAAVRARAHEAMARVFALPQQEKQRYAVPPRTPGFGPYGRARAFDTGAQNLLESWYLEEDGEGPWPPGHAEERSAVDTLKNAVWREVERFLAFAPIILGVIPEAFEALVGRPARSIHLLHYPPMTAFADPRSRRQSRHRDMSLVTFLPAASEPGLQVHARGAWCEVDVADDELLVMSGTILEHLTVGAYPACLHTVEHEGHLMTRRFATPFFVKPKPGVVVEALPQLAARGGEATSGEVTVAELEKEWFARVFRD